MRTTVTLDPDVAARLRALARERGASFTEALNTAVRRGLGTDEGPKKLRLPTRAMGLHPTVNLDKALTLAT